MKFSGILLFKVSHCKTPPTFNSTQSRLSIVFLATTFPQPPHWVAQHQSPGTSGSAITFSTQSTLTHTHTHIYTHIHTSMSWQELANHTLYLKSGSSNQHKSRTLVTWDLFGSALCTPSDVQLSDTFTNFSPLNRGEYQVHVVYVRSIHYHHVTWSCFWRDLLLLQVPRITVSSVVSFLTINFMYYITKYFPINSIKK